MFERDLFVAIVAIALGVFLLHAAIVSRPACFKFWLVKRIEARFGRVVARNVVAITGSLIILLGLYVVLFPDQDAGINHKRPKSNCGSDYCQSSISEPRLMPCICPTTS